MLKKIRENAFGYFHGHEVGGTNPSLLEALGSTELNLLLDVGFNKEVGQEAALYWSKKDGDLARLIDRADEMDAGKRAEYGRSAKERIKSAYSWEFIGSEYKRAWEQQFGVKHWALQQKVWNRLLTEGSDRYLIKVKK